MNTFTQILPQFKEIKLLHSDDFTDEIQTNCAYLLAESNSIAKFIDKIGKRYVHDNKVLNLYDFYTAYNLKFPTVPSTVSLMSPKRLIAMGIKSFDELLQKILDNAGENLPMAVFLSIEARTMEEMLKIKRDILQQFIFLRMYIPIIVSENFKSAKKTFDEILYSTPDEKTDITFIGTKKSGKSSLINAVLGEEYTPSSSELPTPNKVSYLWSGSDKSSISVEYGDNQIYFNDANDVNEYLTREFRRANKTASALRPMQVCIPNFPADLRDFIITDTPGPNFAASQEHTAVTENTLKDIQHAIFIMNYSAHLTDDEILLFDKVYKVLNNKRRHQTMIVAVNRIDEMYAADVIKSYERFADYVLKRLNALGYENIVVVSISAITSVYIEKVRRLLLSAENNSLEKQLRNLRREYKGTDKATAISFVEKSLETFFDFHGVEIENLEQLKQTSRVSYLMKVAESMYDPAEQFEWIDETFEDVFDADFEDDTEFFERVFAFAQAGDIDAMDFVGVLYSVGHGVEQDKSQAFEWFEKAAAADNIIAMYHLAECYQFGTGTSENLKKAVELYKKAANAGEVEAMVSLGAMYFRGQGVDKDGKKAFNWAMKAAELGHVTAMNNVAFQYRHGLGVEQNSAKAVEWYIKSADGGNYSAMCDLAEMYLNGEGLAKNLNKAVEFYKKAANAGEVEAMVSLGAMYFRGEGVEEDEKAAFNWAMKAAELGHVTAMNNVAFQYRHGLGVEQSSAKAVEWYIKAADGGNYSAMCDLAEMYIKGEGIEQDEDRALELYKKAAKNEYEDAFTPLGEIYYSRKNYKKAFEWFTKAAENDSVVAMYYLGMMYEYGEGVEQDDVQSFEWYKKAADKGYSFAMAEIARRYAEGRGVEESFNNAVFWYEKAVDNGEEDAVAELGELYYDSEYYTKAFKYFKRAAENGEPQYMNRIGVMYSAGKGVSKDMHEAVRWYRKAAENGYAWGMYNLAVHYKDGGGIAKNSDEAINWFKKAAENGIDDAFGELGALYYKTENYNSAFYWYKQGAEKGDVNCMNAVGNMYYSGKGVMQDYAKSVNWYRKAANKGYAWAMYNLACNYRDGKGIAKNSDEAINWFKKAAENGIDDAFAEIGDLYYDKENYTQAFHWYKQGAEKGIAVCMNAVGNRFYNGEGVTQNYTAAVNWYRRAMDGGNIWAIRNLGNCYYRGNGVEKNTSKALELFTEAAQKGNSSSMLYLGYMYQEGIAVAQNYDQARSWYEKSRDAGNGDAQQYINDLDEEIKKSKTKSSGGCFITTAVCKSLKKPDDCAELTAFRNFRDTWLINQPNGKNLINQYYQIAPKIVDKINSCADANRIYMSIWAKYLSKCLELIESGQNQACMDVYIDMVKNLEKKYLQGKNIVKA